MEFGFKKLSTKASTTCRQKYGKAAELSSHLVKPLLHDITGCQTGWTTGWTTGCIVSCKQTLNRLFNQFDNRLYRVNGVLHNVSVIKTVTLSKNRTDLVATHVLTGERKCATSCIVWHFSSDNGAICHDVRLQKHLNVKVHCARVQDCNSSWISSLGLSFFFR